jgi:aspartyl-tRNA(Asn)/glutamyl-tRNA(Gln) amidotransferase subunit C
MVLFEFMPEFSKDVVKAVAALANLELEPAEVELFARQLGDVLKHAEELKQIDTTGVSPTAYGVAQETVDRPDVIAPCLPVADALSNAPERELLPRDGGFFKVPRVIG